MIRLVGAALAEQHDERSESRRYLSLESLTVAGALWEAAATARRGPFHHQRHLFARQSRVFPRRDNVLCGLAMRSWPR